MFMAPLSIIFKKWKEPKCQSTNEWINRMWYIPKWNPIQPQKEMKDDVCYDMAEPLKYLC